MTEVLTSAQMRAAEQAAISSGAVTGSELMERAGRGVVEAVLARWPALAEAPQRAVVLCGPGNNGGDGFVVARLLNERGWKVEVFLFGDAARLPPDAAENHRRWVELGGVAPLSAAGPALGHATLIFDALFGTGLTRDLPDDITHLVQAINDLDGPHVVAVDMPTGLNADTGVAMPTALRADLTVTFHRQKRGHAAGRGPGHCGRVVVADIGLPDSPETFPPEA